MATPFPPEKVKLARRVALGADALQLGLLALAWTGPVYVGIVIAVDVLACLWLCILLKPHWAFLPTFVAEGFPIVDVVPLWTIAVRIVTRDTSPPTLPADAARLDPPGR